MTEMHCSTAPAVVVPAAVATAVRSRTRRARPPRVRFLGVAPSPTRHELCDNPQGLIRIRVQ